MTSVSENVEAAERYLAGPRAANAETLAASSPRDKSSWANRIRDWREHCRHCIEGWIERRRPQPRLLSICERLDLGPKKSLTVVAYKGHHFLIACGADTVAAIHEISPITTARDRIPLLCPARWSEQ